MKPLKALFFFVVLLLCLSSLVFWSGFSCTESETAASSAKAAGISRPINEKIWSVTLDAVRPPEEGLLSHLRSLGVTHITLIQFGHQPGYAVPEIRLHNEARWFSESDDGIRILTRQADSLGMKVILKPHIWVGEYHANGQALNEIQFETEAQWQQWEAQYRDFMLHYARLAAEVQAPILVVGAEMATVSRTREAFWRALIADIRAIYPGKLTYAGNWYQEYEHVPFWDALDYIGVQAYFELSKADNPSLEVLKAGWEPYKETLRSLSEKVQKPILFTEIGYRNVSYAAAEPWRWPSRSEVGTVLPDDTLQARLYQAFFESLWHEPWFDGAIQWKWHPEASLKRRNHRLGFSPQGKPAEQVIAQWFAEGQSASSRLSR